MRLSMKCPDNARALCLVFTVTLILSLPAISAGQAAYHGGNGSGYASAEVNDILLDIIPASGFVEEINLYPNPVSYPGSLAVTCSSTEPYQFDIINQMGQTILSQKERNAHFNIPLNSCAPGIYIVHMYNSHFSYMQKLVVAGQK